MSDPPRAHLFGWFRSNMALIVFVSGLLSGAIGTLITGTLAFSDAKHQVTDQGGRISKLETEMDTVQHTNMVDVDRRFNVEAEQHGEQRRVRDAEIATLNSRMAVLEAQLRFFADRTSLPQPLNGARR